MYVCLSIYVTMYIPTYIWMFVHIYKHKHLHTCTLFQCLRLHKVISVYWLLDHTTSQHTIYCSLSPFCIVISSRYQETWFPSSSWGIYLFDQSSLHNLRLQLQWPKACSLPTGPQRTSPSLQWEGDCEWTMAHSDQNAPWGVNSGGPCCCVDWESWRSTTRFAFSAVA